MEIKEYIDRKKDFYQKFKNYIDNDDDNDKNYDELIQAINTYQYKETSDELKQILHLISIISKHHHRYPHFFDKLEKILIYLKSDIKQLISNNQFFDIFKTSKRILLFLLSSDFITMNSHIAYFLYQNCIEYGYYFYPEIEPFLNSSQKFYIKEKINSIDPNFYENFDEKRLLGENDSYICALIRDDSIEEFIRFVNKNCIDLSSKIKSSPFETNYILHEYSDENSLIEYACFFGSMQIINYLHTNGVTFNVNIWIYAARSDNAELFSFLFENHVPFDGKVKQVFDLLVKCHHNQIASFIRENYIEDMNPRYNCIFEFYNYEFFDCEFPSNKDKLLYSCEYGYFTLVKILMETVFLKSDTAQNKLKPSLFGGYSISGEIVLSSDKFTEICKNLFNGCRKLQKVTILSPIKFIRECAFRDCDSLKEVVAPSSVEVIEERCFMKCFSLQHFEIPPLVTEIPYMMFSLCTSLEKVTASSKVTKIGVKAFNSCSSLVEFTIPSSVMYIGEHCFYNCRSLKEVTIPSSVTEINNYTFCNCSSLEKVVLSSNLVKIGLFAFDGCRSLLHIEIPSSTKSIGAYAFRGCSSLTNLTIPSNVRVICAGCFQMCESLEKVTIEPSIDCLRISLFAGCTSLKDITIPSSVIEIRDEVFNGCSSLKQIALPSSVKIIAKDAFKGCELSVKISKPAFYYYFPSNVKVIEV